MGVFSPPLRFLFLVARQLNPHLTIHVAPQLKGKKIELQLKQFTAAVKEEIPHWAGLTSYLLPTRSHVFEKQVKFMIILPNSLLLT